MLCIKCKLRETDPKSGKLWCKECRFEARQVRQHWNKTHPKHFHNGKTYRSRDFVLKELGFSSYNEYLNSGLWKLIRTKVFRVKGYFCHLCRAPATMVRALGQGCYLTVLGHYANLFRMSRISVTFDVPVELHIKIMKSVKKYLTNRSQWLRMAALEKLEKEKQP